MGYWDNDQKDGWGIEECEGNGGVYKFEGMFKFGLPNGIGKKTFKDMSY